MGIEEDRIHDDPGETATAFVAADAGVARLRVSEGRVGEMGLARQCSPADVAAAGDRVAAATGEDVLLGGADGGFEATGFGPAVAVGFDGDPVAAGPDGRIARYAGEWNDCGRLEGVAAIDGGLVAAAGGVYRLDGLAHAGLDAVRDVAAAGPLAATADGLYELGNGWLRALDGDFRAVAADGERAGAAADILYERVRGEWRAVDPPIEEVVDVAYGDTAYALARDGTLLGRAPDGWRSSATGLRGAVAIAVVGG